MSDIVAEGRVAEIARGAEDGVPDALDERLGEMVRGRLFVGLGWYHRAGMNVLALLVPAFALYAVAHRFYAPFLARVFGEDDSRPTPAVTREDGVDYVPTRPHVLFAHHFSAIAAAGPIVGPTWALLYGWIPALLWIVLGAIAIGAVHDYACLFVSMREDGRSIAEIARKTLGVPAFVLYALFIVFNLVVVNAVFINLTAVSLTSLRAPEAMGLPADQAIFRTVAGPKGEPMVVVGGIASTSAIALTAIAPVIGWVFVKRRLVPEVLAYPAATVLCVASVLVGFAWPVSFSAETWTVLIALYVLVAAALPVWFVLQPREFVSVQFLYLGIALLAAAVAAAGLRGVPLQAPPANLALGEPALGFLWPSLFVTIACGAISGFHGLVGSGTTSKQVMRERHARLGYLAMLGESALALCVTLAIAAGVSYADYTAILVKPAEAPAGWKPNPVLAFSVGVAGICYEGLGIPRWLGLVFGLLMVEGFVLDTLDVSIRLNRYLLEEIWSVLFRGAVPRLLKNHWTNSGISVAAMLALAYGKTADALWPIFGSGNQLLASLSLLAVSVWFLRGGRRVAYVLVPAVLVCATTVASLVYLLVWKYYPARNWLLAVTDVVFLALAAGVVASAVSAARAGKTAASSA